MLRHTQIHIVVNQMSQKSDSAIFYKLKRYTTIFLIDFFQKMGASALRLRGPPGPTPISWENILLKKLLCIVCVCKKWHCRFFEAFDLSHYESVRV